MKRCVLALLLLSPQAIFATIVYVHLGPIIFDYLYVALEQARLFNPDRDIVLLANAQAIAHSEYDFSQHAIEAVPVESLKKSVYHQRTPFHSNGSPWQKALERFFYLHDFMASRNVERVMHIESDNMLYVTISDIQDVLDEYNGLGIVLDNDERCIPSCVYIANVKAIEHFAVFLAQEMKKARRTDMQILADYYHTFSSEYVDLLPLFPQEYPKLYEVQNAIGKRPRKAAIFANKVEKFNAVFDAAACGQYLGGIDPRNGDSSPGFINESSFFNPSHGTYVWRVDGQGRKVPHVQLQDGDRVLEYPINNLHIHSKRLHEFRS